MLEQIKQYYSNYDEDTRLVRDKYRTVEFLTTIHYFDKLINDNSSILDCCAGTGRYSFYLADKGHSVTACDLVEHNVNLIKENKNSYKLRSIETHNSLDLSTFCDESFDVVLCMGALYHLETNEERETAIRESVRVCKKGGIIALSYISKMGIILLNLQKGLQNGSQIIDILDDKETGIFRCVSPKELESISEKCGIEKLCNIGVDGVSRLFHDQINNSTEEEFSKYMEYMYRTSCDETILGHSLHGLYFGVKK